MILTGVDRSRGAGCQVPCQEPVSKLTGELGLYPTAFCRWQTELFENGAAAFQTRARANHKDAQERIESPEQKLRRKDEALAELMEE